MRRFSTFGPIGLFLLITASLSACGIRNDVPDFEYPETVTEQRKTWPKLVLTETLTDVSATTNTQREDAQEEADALAERGEDLRKRGDKL